MIARAIAIMSESSVENRLQKYVMTIGKITISQPVFLIKSGNTDDTCCGKRHSFRLILSELIE